MISSAYYELRSCSLMTLLSLSPNSPLLSETEVWATEIADRRGVKEWR